ncbi:glycoside hydrolase N-terminal domain-containing protein [Leadbetterella sp. DM7]|uniref:glycoside hydrolase N-terminal domain-containing protein n=1 Tax=Leadbetterella sp. DM7 TaxID=3235085 RepID=UPI00349E7553
MKALITLMSVLCLAFSARAQDLKLWYNTPSGKTRENALPVGNGFLAAMVYGNPEEEILQLNGGTLSASDSSLTV